MSMVADARVTKTGISVIPKEQNIIRFLVPDSDRLIGIEKPKTPRKPPSRIQFGLLRNRNLRMLRSIPLSIDRKGATVVAAWDEIEEFGYGRNITEALEDFGRTIEELFTTLSEKQQALSEDLARVWSVVSRHIEFRHRG
jgi:hypothetical protein